MSRNRFVPRIEYEISYMLTCLLVLSGFDIVLREARVEKNFVEALHFRK